jgi:autotransporter-associated beta strand protein
VSDTVATNQPWIAGIEIVNNASSVSNNVLVTANSTIDVTGITSMTMGNLSIGANTLFVTGGSDTGTDPYSLTLGTVTLTGNATFNVANNKNGSGSGSLTLGAIGDGGVGYGISVTGPGTVVLPGANTYGGTTQVTGGTLMVTGSLANESSAYVLIGPSPTAPTTIAADSPLVQLAVAPNASYAGIGSSMIGDLQTTADILGGTNTIGSGFVNMQWRQRASNEMYGGNPTSPPLPTVFSQLISDVINLFGMSTASGEPVQTDPFVLQMSYAASLLKNESAQAANGAIYLAWLNPTGAGPTTPEWQNAITGNFGPVGADVGTLGVDYQGSFSSFLTAEEAMNPGDFPSDPTAANLTNAELNLLMDAYGVDISNHDAWAVVNHNSEFAVVPEPSSIILAAFGLLGCLWAMRRRLPKLAHGAGAWN